MTKLVIFTTHPIQYQAPWFRAFEACDGLDIEVVFSYIPDRVQQGVGFGTGFEWDIPLLDGYNHRVLAAAPLPAVFPAYTRNRVRGIRRALDEIKPDVAMILGWQEISLVQALIACRRRSIPIILRGESNALRARPPLVSMLHRFYFRLCDAFLAIGRANREFYCQSGVPEERILGAGYFVDNDRFSRLSSALQEQRFAIRNTWSIPDSATCFAFVAKLEPKKCVMDYLLALEHARERGADIFGLIVGSGEELSKAQRLVADKSLPVTFAGFLNQSEIARAYVAADALVLPSDFGETWGLVVNEAMASCIPAIVSDRIGAANDLVIDGQTGLVFPHGDTRALADAMLRLTRDPADRRRMGVDARAHVFEGFSIAHAVEQTREAIRMVTWQRYEAA